MSTLINFSIFPLDKGESVSMHVARALKIIRDSGLAYKLNPMGTAIEGEWDEVMDIVSRCFEEIKKDCDRVYMTVNADYRKGKSGRIDSKVKSVEEKLTIS
ncbi:MAG: MTH1187 family thiamine-binding protein [Thermodesulfobacteriota bacterium]|nr:MTH1187 family thiamine-binding protein [Thermodesulfobacteriota bacterium]